MAEQEGLDYNCPSCVEGEILNTDMYGSWISKCSLCNGTGKLNETTARNLARVRAIYREKHKKET